MNSPITLTTLVEAALTAFPALAYTDGGSRADAAADLIQEHKVNYLGVQFGLDWWEINQQRVSIKNGTCTCHDYAAPVAGKARLCKHMLAAMFQHKIESGQQSLLIDILSGAPGDKVVLKLDVFGKGRDLEYWLGGYHYPGQAWQSFSYEERHQITEAMFEAAVRAAGFCLSAAASKQPGYAHHFPLARLGTAEENADDRPRRLSDLTGENRRRFDQLDIDERVLARIAAA
jgi:hypothetical protein